MPSPKKFKRVVALDGHRLGLVSGAMIALVVMAISFFYQQVEFSATGIRAGWAFVAGYAGTFFLVRVILRTTLFEFLQFEQKTAKSTSRLGRTDIEEEIESSASTPEAVLPHELLAAQAEEVASDTDAEEFIEAEVQRLGR